MDALLEGAVVPSGGLVPCGTEGGDTEAGEAVSSGRAGGRLPVVIARCLRAHLFLGRYNCSLLTDLEPR